MAQDSVDLNNDLSDEELRQQLRQAIANSTKQDEAI
jgi:hypothetical protein